MLLRALASTACPTSGGSWAIRMPPSRIAVRSMVAAGQASRSRANRGRAPAAAGRGRGRRGWRVARVRVRRGRAVAVQAVGFAMAGKQPAAEAGVGEQRDDVGDGRAEAAGQGEAAGAHQVVHAWPPDTGAEPAGNGDHVLGGLPRLPTRPATPAATAAVLQSPSQVRGRSVRRGGVDGAGRCRGQHVPCRGTVVSSGSSNTTRPAASAGSPMT
jgi:hypothetical protein